MIRLSSLTFLSFLRFSLLHPLFFILSFFFIPSYTFLVSISLSFSLVIPLLLLIPIHASHLHLLFGHNSLWCRFSHWRWQWDWNLKTNFNLDEVIPRVRNKTSRLQNNDPRRFSSQPLSSCYSPSLWFWNVSQPSVSIGITWGQSRYLNMK